MHFSAKRGIEIVFACRLSVRLSVTLVDQDHTRWKSWKISAQTISAISSLFVAQSHPLNTRGTYGNFAETRGGVRRVAYWSTKAATSLKRVKIEEKLLAYRNSPTFFRTVPSPNPYGLPFPKIGGLQPQPRLQSLLSQEWVKLWTANLADTFTGAIRTKAHEKFGRKGSVGESVDCPNF